MLSVDLIEKDELYPSLLGCATRVIKQSRNAIDKVKLAKGDRENAQRWISRVEYFITLLLKVIDQTQRHVYNEEGVPASQKNCSVC